MARVLLSRRAKTDLLQIWNYLAEGASLETADRILRLLYDQCDFLARAGGLGELHPELGPGIRAFSAKNYVIFFERRPEGIDVLRIVHGSRDWTNLI
jgi:toxin ParE1/3/4